MKKLLLLGTALCAASVPAFADDGVKGCALGAGAISEVEAALNQVIGDGNGGIFTPNMMWAALVDRNGVLCGTAKVGDAFPASRAIAIAKAETANGLSNNKLALSTANLYAPTQPGGSLYGLNNANPFNPFFNSVTTDNSMGLYAAMASVTIPAASSPLAAGSRCMAAAPRWWAASASAATRPAPTIPSRIVCVACSG